MKRSKKQINVAVQHRFSVPTDNHDVVDHGEQTEESIARAAAETFPACSKRAKKNWMTADILNLMDDRRKLKQNREGYNV